MADTFTYNGTDVATYSVAVMPAKTSGLRGMATFGHDLTTLRKRDRAAVTFRGRRAVPLTLGGVISGTSRANYQSNITSMHALVRPTVTSGVPVFKALTWSQMSGRRLMVLSLDFAVTDLTDMRGEFTWSLIRYPFWQGSTATTENAADGDLVLANPGDLTAEPVWTVTVLKAAGLSGYTWTVNGLIFQYTGALAQNDVLTIDSAAKTVKKNGTLDLANVGATSSYPTLAPGNNTVSGRTCLDADATLSANFWAEYEA